ncbi:hypothetical protein LY76DRAFT_614159 [Colletotrichum caudatum]|nr:hypothetical protein LY76DRAFT_614159 [Colletotrichum caudatum]
MHAWKRWLSYLIKTPPVGRMPHLDFVYRIVCNMGPSFSEISNVDSSSITRIVLPILGGSVKGPRIQGKIVERSGADWLHRSHAQKIRAPLISITGLPGAFGRLNARHTLETDDGIFILVSAQGVFYTGPQQEIKPPQAVSQDNVEDFPHIRFEAPGNSHYSWMNAIVAVGVTTMFEGKSVVDRYRLTNFPNQPAAHL